MAKLKNVTEDEMKAAEERAFDVGQLASDLHRRASQGYADHLTSPIQLASAFASASRSLAELSAYCLLKASLQEQEREIKESLRGRMEKA